MSFSPGRDVPRKEPAEDCVKTLGNTTINAEACELNDRLYHRTSLNSLKNIVEDGSIKPSKETGVVSFTSNPSSFVGGAIRTKMDVDEVNTLPPLRRMCYVTDDEEREKLEEKKRNKRENMEKGGRFDPGDTGVFSPNRFRAEVGLSTPTYSRECEFMSDDEVDADNIEKVELFVEGNGGIVNTTGGRGVADVNTTYNGLGQLRDKIEQAKDVAQENGFEFGVNSCYSYMLVDSGQFVGDYKYAKLDQDNLKRLANGEELKTFTQSDRIDPRNVETFC